MNMQAPVHFSTADELERALPQLAARGVTELTVQDAAITAHKGRLLRFLQLAAEQAPDVFYTLPLEAAVLDMDVAKAASRLYCSIELPLRGTSKGGAYLFDKKLYARRAAMLNELGLVFGVSLDFAATAGDAVKLFRDRLDFAASLYPNHIDFPQLDARAAGLVPPKPSATFSTQDIQRAREAAFACTVFYSMGRAVPWFLSALAPLKLTPSRFFQDFAEWQRVNNCGLQSDWAQRALADGGDATVAERAAEASGARKAAPAPAVTHRDVEAMQLAFLRFKYEEKNKEPLFAAVTDIVHLNGALARCAGEGEESSVVLQYSPDDLLSPAAQNIAAFSDSVCMEDCRVRVFYSTERGIDWELA